MPSNPHPKPSQVVPHQREPVDIFQHVHQVRRREQRLDDTIETYSDCAEVMEIIDFIKADGSRPLCLPEREV